MARFLARVRDRSPARIFTLDARPVMFIFGTHTWGSLPLNRTEIAAMERSIGGAIEEFADVYGAPPYLVGEEMQLSATGSFSDDRRIRSGFFDGIYIYHHASNLKRGTEQRLRMSPAYIQNQITILRNTYADSNNLRSRFTGRRLLVIPNLAPGFAKPGHPTIEIDRGGYADFMKLIKKVHMDGHIMQQWSAVVGQAAPPAPVYVVGSLERGVRRALPLPVRVQPVGAERGTARLRCRDGTQGSLRVEPLRVPRYRGRRSHSDLRALIAGAGVARVPGFE